MTLHCSQSTRLLTPHSVTEGGLGACCVLGCEGLPAGQKAQLARQSQRHRQGRDKGTLEAVPPSPPLSITAQSDLQAHQFPAEGGGDTQKGSGPFFLYISETTFV